MRKILNFLYNMLPLICGGLLMLIGAVLGGIDAWGPGMGAGGLIGLLFGTVVSFIVTNSLVLLFGKNATVVPTRGNSDEAYAETLLQRGRRCVFRTLLIVALVVALHDCYWFAHMWMATSNHNAGAYMTSAIAHDYSREQLQDDLKAHRWRHDVLAARPLKWLFGAEAQALNQANQELIDVVTGKRMENLGSNLNDMPAVEALAERWRSSYWFGHAVTDRALSIYGTDVCNFTAEKLPGHQSRGWVLRYLPAAWFR
jgi:hypothetical protein